MLHKKIEDIISDFIKQEGYNEEDAIWVEELIMAQFTAIKKEQKELTHENIEIPYLGSLFAKAWTIKRELTILENKVKNFKKKSDGTIGYQVLKDEYATLKDLYQRMVTRYEANAILIEKRKVVAEKEKRDIKRNGHSKDTKTSLGKSEPDSGGFI